MAFSPSTVIETPEFLAASRKLLSEAERHRLIDYIAYHPLGGDLIPGTGGVRKLRWALDGRGKSGGARVIYFYHNPKTPVFVLTAYAKNEQADISQQDRNEMRQLTSILAARYGGKSNG